MHDLNCLANNQFLMSLFANNLPAEYKSGSNITESLNYILSDHSIDISLSDSISILLLSLLLGLYLRYLFCRFSNSFSSKVSFGNTILVVTLSVASLIAIVKSSLALSLGLVGALSVVRFRTAVKEPYSLAFLLLSICIGISIGASQYKFACLLTIAATLIIIYIYKDRTGKESTFFKSTIEDLDTLSISLNSKVSIGNISKIIANNTKYFKIVSWDVGDNDITNLVAKVRISDHESLMNLEKEVNEKYQNCSFNFYSSPS